MTTRLNRQVLAICAIFLTSFLGGCVSQTDSEADVASDANPVVNSPPVISGSPQNAVTTGDSYSFTPTASDPDGDKLTFSVTNKPSWATFDTATGTLSGTPTLGSAGMYADIQVSVSDGKLDSSLAPFLIDVVDIALGSVTLTWTPPTQNEDGSTLSLTAYRFYFGTESGNYTNSVQVNNPGIASYVIDNLVPDAYFFAATAVNSEGVESAFSNEAIKQVL